MCAPHILGKLVPWHVLVGVQREHAQDEGLLVPADRGRRAVDEQLERPEDVDANCRCPLAGELGRIDAKGGGERSQRGLTRGRGASLLEIAQHADGDAGPARCLVLGQSGGQPQTPQLRAQPLRWHG